MITKTVMDVDELAQEMGCSRTTILRLTNKGFFPFAVNIGLGNHKYYRFSIPGYHAWLSEKKSTKGGENS